MDNNAIFKEETIDVILGKILSGNVKSKEHLRNEVVALVTELSQHITETSNCGLVTGHIRTVCLDDPGVLYSIAGTSGYANDKAYIYKNFDEPLSGWVAGWVYDKDFGREDLKNAYEDSVIIKDDTKSLIINDTKKAKHDLFIKQKIGNVKIDQTGVCSIMITPLRYKEKEGSKGRLVGVLVVECISPDLFKNQSLVDFIEKFAFRITSAIDNMYYFCKEVEEKEKIKKLNEKVAELLNKSNLVEIYKFIVEDATSYIFNASKDNTKIYLQRKIGNKLYTV